MVPVKLTTSDALRQYVEWCEMGIIDKDLVRYLKPEPSEREPYRRVFHVRDSREAGEAGGAPIVAADRMDVDL